MASQLDLEEQEQLDELKHFWKRWGDLIMWLLIADWSEWLWSLIGQDGCGH
jgi:predicted negative regulator of RcsB-dependent stress response